MSFTVFIDFLRCPHKSLNDIRDVETGYPFPHIYSNPSNEDRRIWGQIENLPPTEDKLNGIWASKGCRGWVTFHDDGTIERGDHSRPVLAFLAGHNSFKYDDDVG